MKMGKIARQKTAGGGSPAAVMLAPYFPAGNTGTASIPSCPPALPGGSSSGSTGIGIQGGSGAPAAGHADAEPGSRSDGVADSREICK